MSTKAKKYTVNKNSLKGKWFDYSEHVSVKLRPFSIFNMNSLPG